jgi:acetyl esterase/lipase
MSEYVHHSTPDLEFKELLPNLPAPAHGPIDIAAQREQVRTIVTPLIMETHRPRLPAGELMPSSLSGSGFIHWFISAESSYRLEDRKVTVDGGEITVRCIQPIPKAGETGGFPVLVYIHGGGQQAHLLVMLDLSHDFLPTFYPAFVTGDLDIDDFFLRTISVDFRISIVNVDYR